MSDHQDPAVDLYATDAPHPPRSRLLLTGAMLLGVGFSGPFVRGAAVGMMQAAPPPALLTLADWLWVLLVPGLACLVIGVRRTRQMRAAGAGPAKRS